MVEGIDEHEGLLVGSDIATNLLTEHLGIAIDIEEIILQLESQTNLLTKLIQVLGIFLRSISQNSTNLQSTSQEYAGLETDHLDILLFFHIVACLKLHIILLSLSYFESGGGEDFQHLGKMLFVTLCHALIGKNQHAVAREDGCIGIPLLVNGLVTTAQIGIVHQVIMEQGIVVISLQGDGIHQDFLRVVLEDVVTQEHQGWTDALAPHREYILYRLI